MAYSHTIKLSGQLSQDWRLQFASPINMKVKVDVTDKKGAPFLALGKLRVGIETGITGRQIVPTPTLIKLS